MLPSKMYLGVSCDLIYCLRDTIITNSVRKYFTAAYTIHLSCVIGHNPAIILAGILILMDGTPVIEGWQGRKLMSGRHLSPAQYPPYSLSADSCWSDARVPPVIVTLCFIILLNSTVSFECKYSMNIK